MAMRLAPANNVSAVPVPWGGPRTPFLELTSAIDRFAVVCAAVDAHSDATVRLWAEGQPPGLNGCLLQLRGGIPTRVFADVVADPRSPAPSAAPATETDRSTSKRIFYSEANDPIASRETTDITTQVPLPFIWHVYPLDASVTDGAKEAPVLNCSVKGGRDGVAFSYSGSGDLGYLSRPPFGYQQVSAAFPVTITAHQDMASLVIQTIGHNGRDFMPWVEADFARSGGKWQPFLIDVGALKAGYMVQVHERLRIIGSGPTWAASPLAPNELAAALRASANGTLATPPPAAPSDEQAGKSAKSKLLTEADVLAAHPELRLARADAELDQWLAERSRGRA